MPFPTTAFGVVAVIVLLVPGLVYTVVRRHVKGFRYDDLTKDARIAQALIVSVLLDALYLLGASAWLSKQIQFRGDNVSVTDPKLVALAVLAGAFAAPAIIALLFNSPVRIRRRNAQTSQSRPAWIVWLRDNFPGKLLRGTKILLRRLANKIPLRIVQTVHYHPVPTAWDWGATDPDPRMVRITLPDGRQLGGFWGPGSYVSTYPEPRDIFISHQYKLKDDGSFDSPAEGAAGLWLRIGDEHIVEFLEPSYSDTPQQGVTA